MTQPHDAFGLLLAHLRTILGAGYVVKYEYPEEKQADLTKRYVIVDLLSTRAESYVGQAAPTGAAGASLVKHTLSVRVEAWSGPSALAGATSNVLDDAGKVKQRFDRKANADALLAATGLKVIETTDCRTLPFDGQFPGWARAATWVTFTLDEVF